MITKNKCSTYSVPGGVRFDPENIDRRSPLPGGNNGTQVWKLGQLVGAKGRPGAIICVVCEDTLKALPTWAKLFAEADPRDTLHTDNIANERCAHCGKLVNGKDGKLG